VKSPVRTLVTPQGAQSLRDEILALAGADKRTLAELTRKAIRVADEAMDATKVERVTHQGEVKATFNDVDHRARIEGADRAFDLIGARVSKSSSQQASSGPQTVVVVIERAAGPQRVEAQVIDAEPVTPQ